jgi:hypothetical protein
MANYLYVMAAKSIQKYILSGNKLRLMVGASELVEGLAESFIPDILQELGWQSPRDYEILSRTAGGIRITFADDKKAAYLQKIIPLAVDGFAPGLEIVQTVVKIDNNLGEALSQSQQKLRVKRNALYPEYPIPNPMVKRVPSTGNPMIVEERDGEPLDRVMLAKHSKAEDARQTLSKKLLSVFPDKKSFVDDFSKIASRDNSLMAVLHIDGNGMGGYIMRAVEELPNNLAEAKKKYSEICANIAECTKQALTETLQEFFSNAGDLIPCRPVVCAGDDVTLILPATGALEFAVSLLKKFAKKSNEILKERLTACAGIVYCKHNYPVVQAYELCESLVKYAKKQLDRQMSGIAYWRLTNAIADDFESIIGRELTASGIRLTEMPYIVASNADNNADKPTVDQLLKLRDGINGLPRGSVRKLVTAFYNGEDFAENLYKRMKEVAETEKWITFESALLEITKNDMFPALRVREQGRHKDTPLYDVLELIAAERSGS